MERVSGSKSHRAWKCPASTVLPHADNIEPSPPAIRGSDIHEFLEHVKELGFDQAIAAAPEELRPLLAAIDVDSLPVHLSTEVAFAYDWRARTAREIGRNLNRHYELADPPLGPTEIPVTVDLLGGEDAGTIRRVFVGDYKTGRTRYPRPDKFGQTLLGGLCASKVYKAQEARLELIYINEAGDDFRSRATVDEWELETFADEFAAARELALEYEKMHAAGQELPVREGDHCDHCPAFKSCRAKIGLVKHLPTEILQIQASPFLAPDRIAEAYLRCEQMRTVIGMVEAEIFAQAAIHGEIELGDGRVLGVVTTRKEFLDGPKAAAVLEERYGRAAVEEAVTIKMSKDALREAVAKRRGPDEKISTKKNDGVLDRIMAEIRQRGGVEWRETTDVRAHQPRRRLPKVSEP